MGTKNAELAEIVRQLARAVPYISLSWIIWNLVRGRPTSMPFGVFITSLFVFIALQPETVTFPGRASMEMTKGQSFTLKVSSPTYEQARTGFRTKVRPISTNDCDLTGGNYPFHGKWIWLSS